MELSPAIVHGFQNSSTKMREHFIAHKEKITPTGMINVRVCSNIQ